MTRIERERQVGRLHAQFDKWSRDPSNKLVLHDNVVRRLREALTEPDDARGARTAAARLASLSRWYGPHGLCELIQGNTDGWHAIERSRVYRVTSLKILARAYEADGAEPSGRASGFTWQTPGLLLAHSILVGDVAGTREVAGQCDRSFKTGFFGTMDPWPSARFILAMAHRLSAEVSASPVDEAGLPSAYATLLHDTDVGVLEAALVAACDYHLEQAVASSQITQYDPAPYALWPVEIWLSSMAVLSGNRIEHPLLDVVSAGPPSDAVASVAGLSDDEFLEPVRARATAAGLWREPAWT